MADDPPTEALATDTTRIAVAGYSAGGITALGVSYWDPGVQHADVQAVLSISGGLHGSEDVLDAGEPPLFVLHGELDSARPYMKPSQRVPPWWG